MEIKELFKTFRFEQNEMETLNESFLLRFTSIPNDYSDFLKQFSLLINQNETTWFNSISDFNENNNESEFKWNEFELISIAAFEDDPKEQDKIKLFWNNHLPIILSVQNGYSFFAIGTNHDNYGKIYYGEEPEFEEVELIADDLKSFLLKISNKTLPENLQQLF